MRSVKATAIPGFPRFTRKRGTPFLLRGKRNIPLIGGNDVPDTKINNGTQEEI